MEQLYSGTQRALAVVALSTPHPRLLQDVLKSLAFLPQQIQDLRRSSSRAGDVAALSRAKAWLPELDPVDLALGYPSLKEDGNAFDDHDFTTCVKAIRPVVSGKLIHEHLWDRRTEPLSVRRGAEIARRADRGEAHEQFTQLRSSPER